MIKAVRGAVKIDEDTPESIRGGVVELMNTLLEENCIREGNIVSLVFSMTGDLRSRNPASALRTRGYESVPLFCCKEPDIEGMMPRVIRVLVTVRVSRFRSLTPVYVNGAEGLRPDLTDPS
jgi:chorismate mutase